MNTRERFLELMESAAEAGVAEAKDFMRMTPREIALTIKANEAKRREALESIDLLAWLAGGYAAMGVNAPRRYPKRPDRITKRPARMTDAEMKAALFRLAGHNGRDADDT